MYKFICVILFALCATSWACAGEIRTFVVPVSKIESAQIEALLKGTTTIIPLPELQSTVINTDQSREDVEKIVGRSVTQRSSFDVYLFDGPGCDDRAPAPVAVTPFNVCRIVGSQSDRPTTTSDPVIWVVDSGLDGIVSASGVVTVGTAVDCTTTGICHTVSPSALTDKVGHGTMIASIIGGGPSTADPGVANPVTTSPKGSGVFGVRPRAIVNPVKVFETAKTNAWTAPLAGLDWLKTNGASGDIVNISWGAYWGAARVDFSATQALETKLRELADKGLIVVVAAGNGDSDSDGPWASMVFPANLGGYLAPSGPGKIVTVTAVESTQAGTLWTDAYWASGGYGSVAAFAEPGVHFLGMFRSKKKALQVNSCSGTSFAAPVLAALLLPSVTGPILNKTITDTSTATHLMEYIKEVKCAPDP